MAVMTTEVKKHELSEDGNHLNLTVAIRSGSDLYRHCLSVLTTDYTKDDGKLDETNIADLLATHDIALRNKIKSKRVSPVTE